MFVPPGAPQAAGTSFPPRESRTTDDVYGSGGAGAAPRRKTLTLQRDHGRSHRAEPPESRGQEPGSDDGSEARGAREEGRQGKPARSREAGRVRPARMGSGDHREG